MTGLLLAAFRLAAYVALTLPLMPIQALAVRFGWRLAKRLPRAYHRIARRILGFRVEVIGIMSSERPTLFVSNHCSYLDITMLASEIPGSFVAKSEVRDWPFFGWLARLQRTVFVDRRRTTSHGQRDDIASRLQAGDDLILFPEGTSSDGNRTLPFKSALLSAADISIDGRPLTVQPVSIAYTMLDGVPLGRAKRPLVAWYGDMDLAGHLWQALKLGVITAEIRFFQPVTLPELGSRKALAQYCHSVISAGVAASLTGRDPVLPPPPIAAPTPALSGPEPAPAS